jgi:DNA-binding HxlR family transcriptional regulator
MIVQDRKFVRTCSIWRALDLLGDVAVLLVLGAAFMGSRRFDDFQRRTLLQKTTLSDRLQRLVEEGCLRKAQYSPHASRFEYRLTRKGVDLYAASLMTLGWEARWVTETASRYRVELRHVECGQTTEPVLVDAPTGEVITIDTVHREAGPGEGFARAQHRRRRRQADVAAQKQEETVFPNEVNSIIGDRWSALILRSIFDGVHRYDELLRDTWIATNILTDRLKTLTEAGLIVRSDQDEGEYVLTARGRDTYPIFLTLMRWGDTWCPAPEGPPVLVWRQDRKALVDPAPACSRCGGLLDIANTSFEIKETRHGAGTDA